MGAAARRPYAVKLAAGDVGVHDGRGRKRNQFPGPAMGYIPTTIKGLVGRGMCVGGRYTHRQVMEHAERVARRRRLGIELPARPPVTRPRESKAAPRESLTLGLVQQLEDHVERQRRDAGRGEGRIAEAFRKVKQLLRRKRG